MTTASANQRLDAWNGNEPLLSELHGTETVVIIVGPEKKKFSIHKALLIATSDYFARLLDNMSAESGGVVKLRQHSPTAFKVVYQWLYNGRKLPPQHQATEDCTDAPRFWLELLMLTDELQMQELKRYAYDEIFRLFKPGSAWEASASQELVA
jgi:hypothetical protein